MATEIPGLEIQAPPPPAFFFLVQFLNIGEQPSMGSSLDARFQKVSGLEISVPLAQQLQAGGQSINLPGVPTYSNLTLERGYAMQSGVREQFMQAVSQLQFTPQNILIILLDHQEQPKAAWMCYGALLTRWSLGDLDASQSSFLIESMELTYQRMSPQEL